MERLFVYGTLAPGRANHHVLAQLPGTWQPATLKGNLFAEGWGAEQGCPGIVPAVDGDDIAGFLFSSAALTEYWPTLDQFEGEGYQRLPVTVRTDRADAVQAFVYALNR